MESAAMRPSWLAAGLSICAWAKSFFFLFFVRRLQGARNSVLGKHLWADMNAPLTTTTYSTQDSEELIALPATSKLTNRGKGS